MNGYPLLDLFSSYGGFSLAFEAVAHPGEPSTNPHTEEVRPRHDSAGESSCFRTIAFSEIDPYASAILAHRWPTVPNLGDVRDITADSVLRECGVLPVVVTGGFPCQPHSHAGKRQASLDERDLWDECARVLGELRPRFALFENVAGLLSSESGLFSTEFYRTWPKSGMAVNGKLYPLPTLATLLTAESASGSSAGTSEAWLTPRANEPGHDPNFVERNGDRGAHCFGTLSDQAETLARSGPPPTASGLPDPESPSTSGSRAAWSTPMAMDDRETTGMRPSRLETNRSTEYLHRQVNTPTGKLNPAWVETLMGLPLGHTQLPWKFVKPKAAKK